MLVIKNKLIPFKGFTAINLFGVFFIRSEKDITDEIINHEYIHTAQMKELLYLPFYIWYLTEWAINLIIYKDPLIAYKNICFEREAHEKEKDTHYLEYRKYFAFRKYIKKL